MSFTNQVEEMVSLLRAANEKTIQPLFGKVTTEVKERIGDFEEEVTQADTDSSDFILSRIRGKMPGSYSEEDITDERFNYPLLWQLDTLDGTTEFGAGMANGYAMHAALLQRQRGLYVPVAGIVFRPGTDTIWTHDGNVVRRIQDGEVSPMVPADRDSIRGYVRAVDPNDRVGEFYETLGQKLGLPVKKILSGGSGASLVDLLEGNLNLVVMNYDYTKEWDLAMAVPIVEARGGWVCDLNGNDFTFNRPYEERHNRNGYVMSIAFTKDEVLPEIKDDLLIRTLD
ncbi:inositol monophosphatase family protein [Nanoarchaeota archaeon]